VPVARACVHRRSASWAPDRVVDPPDVGGARWRSGLYGPEDVPAADLEGTAETLVLTAEKLDA